MRLDGKCTACGSSYSVNLPDTPGSYDVRCPKCRAVNTEQIYADTPPVASPAASLVAARVRRLEIISCVIWLVLGVVQVVFVYTAAAGAWNIVNAIIGLVNVRNIQAGNPAVVPYYEQRRVWLIVFAVVNLILGGVVGVLLVAFDWYIRDYVLRNRSAF
ncbi:MAG: hypothetical protein ACI4HO_08955 [Ruminococcus sp.]